MSEEDLLYHEESRIVIGACYEVHNELGHGFLESVYSEALSIAFTEKSIPFEISKRLDVWYKGYKLEKYFVADFICFDKIIIELKACDGLLPEHTAQVLNYLKATNFRLGLIVNFGTPRMQIKRIIF